MTHAIVATGLSRSFPPGDPFLHSGLSDAIDEATADVLILLGQPHYRPDPARIAILIELGTECLGVHTGEASGEEGSNAIGFARYRNGDDPPSQLVELVRQPRTAATAVSAARAVFEAAGLTVVECSDQAGRIIDRLVRPKYNVALRFLDEGLATAADMDLTCRLGLGYPDGPIERVVRGGLAVHHDITRALFETHGTPAYAPARRSLVAAQRRARGEGT
jgi:3-hydroxybutyryl-CoA dehydrogenase